MAAQETTIVFFWSDQMFSQYSLQDLLLSVCYYGRPRFDPWVGKIFWRRKWQLTPVFLPGESQGRKSLVGYSPRGRKESDMTEWLHFISLHFRAVLRHTCDINLETRIRSSCHPLPPLLSWSCQTAGFKSEMAMAEPLCWEVGEFKDAMNFLKLGSVSSFSINLSVLHALQCSDQETMAQQT